MSEFLELQLASIEAGNDRARPINPETVDVLAAIIKKQGLMQPIVVREVDGGYRLIAGHHRLEAVRKLGWSSIQTRILRPANDEEAKLAEVMENLGRGELIALDRCQHLFEMKRVWELLHPETAHGKASPKSRNPALSSDGPEVFGFVRTVAENFRLGQTQIKEAVRIWNGLYPSVRTRLRGTALAKKQTELKALSELAIAQQIKVMDLVKSDDHPDIENVAAALEHLSTGVTPDALEKRFAAASRSFGALDDATFDHVLTAHEERIIASLKRRGRI